MKDFWNRIYISMGRDFLMDSNGLDFEKLIDEVAIHKRVHNGLPLMEEVETNGIHNVYVFRGRTKRFIVQRTNAFISGMKEVKSADENMASFTSKRQLNKLSDAFRGKNKRISAYALVIIYVMFVIILENPCESVFDLTLMKNTVTCVSKWVQAYSAEYPNDELAVFLLDCFRTVFEALQNRNPNVTADNFPYIPKTNPDDSTDC